jgi:hypothetical protein
MEIRVEPLQSGAGAEVASTRIMRRWLCACSVMVVSVFATPALADPPAGPEAAIPETSSSPPAASSEAQPPPVADTQERHWYGWQTLIVDGVGILTLPVLVGFGVYLVGAPIVHWAHGRVGLGFADVGMRLGLAVGLGVVAYARTGAQHMDLLPAALLFSVIESPAIALDASLLEWEQVERPKVAPLVVPRREGGAMLGVVGTF